MAKPALAVVSPTPVSLQRKQAVFLARKGKVREAAIWLARLHKQFPANDVLTGDLIVVAGWAGRYQEALRLFTEKNAGLWPDYVRYAMVDTYRSLHRPRMGLRLINELLKKQPDNYRWQLRRILLLIDIGQLDRAAGFLNDLAGQGKKDRDFHLASAYLHERRQDWLAALSDYQHARQLVPDDPQLVVKEILALNHLRAPSLALAKVPTLSGHPLSSRNLSWLLAGRAAQLLRWSTDAQKDFRETRFFAMQALALQIEALALLGDDPDNLSRRRRLYLDILISLRNLRRMQNLQELYRILAAEGPMPDYVRQALADSLLVTHEPDRAAAIYQDLVTKNPKNYEASLGLFYARVEEEDFQDAYRLIDSMIKHEPRGLAFWDSKAKYPNERYLDLQVIAAQARLYGDQLENAWSRIDKLTNMAPVNNWLHEVRGQVANARSWPRQALADFQTASLLQPASLDAVAGKATSLIQLNRLDEVRPLLHSLQQTHPFEHTTQDLAKDWRFTNKPSYYSDITISHSSGPDLNGNGLVASAEAISPPLNDIWYLSAGYRYAWSEIIEGEETFNRSAAGLEYRHGNWDILGQLTYNDSTRTEMGGLVKAIWQANDFWNLSLTGERFSTSTPLRALYHDIRADSVAASLNWRESEQREVGISSQYSDFTDGNTRVEIGGVLRQRLLDLPHLDVDVRINIYGSTNSKTDVPYYSPEHDFSLQGAMHIDHVYHRYYQHLFAQQLDVAYGIYDQKGYASRWIGHIRYEHRYKFTPWLEFLAGIEFGQNVYDGHAEPYRLARFMINGKF